MLVDHIIIISLPLSHVSGVITIMLLPFILITSYLITSYMFIHTYVYIIFYIYIFFVLFKISSESK